MKFLPEEIASLLEDLKSDHEFVISKLGGQVSTSGDAKQLITELLHTVKDMEEEYSRNLKLTEEEYQEQLEEQRQEIVKLREELIETQKQRDGKDCDRANAIMDYLSSQGIGFIEYVSNPELRKLRDVVYGEN